MRKVFFSIITATKNPENILPTLKSLKKQNTRNYENIIIDSSSKQIEPNIKKKFKFRYFYNKKLSLYQALNFGIKQSKGEVIFFLHSDDILSSKKILRIIHQNFKQKKNEILYGNINMIAKKFNRLWISGKFKKEKIFHGWHPPHTAFFCKRDMFYKYGFFKTQYSIASDYELILRFLLSTNEKKIKYIPVSIINMKIGGKSSKSLINIIKSNIEVVQILKNLNFKNYYKVTFQKIISKIFQIRFK